MIDFELWEAELKTIWDQLGLISNADFIEKIKVHTETLCAHQRHAIADFERACVYDSTGSEKDAEPLYRSALHLGLTGLRRRRARIQLASTLRNNGKTDESIEILREEKENYSDELDDAVNAFLALSLSSINNDKEALSVVLESLSKHLPRYNKSVYHYSKKLLK
ncbi:Tetratrico peptide repeat-containing protein [Chryseobacterium carnipullorum]|uniref:tetratricopeptide repeat protein n=1 Tax=Chryseobacterium carnipullorum TaxID=1124835 RepID=UPI0009192773|nr:tetratricopeptide repeat protein [Chryseobacterium carnipullorum]SHL55326.1 Tetratrico peptide repeat-containing protein [Chryseobacterium carnipullorum]